VVRVQIDIVTGFLLANWVMLILGAFVVTIIAFVVKEYEEDRDAQEVGRAVGDRTQRLVGGAAGLGAGVFTGILGGLYEAGMTFGDAFEIIGDILVSAPQMVSGLTIAGLGFAWIEGLIPLGSTWFLGLAMVIVGLGTLAAMQIRSNSSGVL
jgi:ABC-type phosphate transport system permease subunit